MKIKVPYFKSAKDTDCGPLALKMVLAYFNKEVSFEEIAKLEKQLDSGMVWSLGIALASKKLGYNTKFISKSNFTFEEDLEFYKKHANDQAKIILEEIKRESKKINIELEEKDLSLNELLGFISENSIPIVLINWYKVAGKEGFNGHFLPIVGYDENYVYVHNPGMKMAEAYLPIKRDIFLKAWKDKGTDNDTIIIYRH